jgi:hypothetical protein
MRAFLIILCVLGAANRVKAQDSIKQVQRKNTIKLELSQTIYPNSFIMSYERVTWPNQTVCIIGGYEEFPHIISVSSTVRVRQDLLTSGFKAGVDYRFYLKKENKYHAPHGIYIGPYISYHSFMNKRDIEVETNGIQEFAQLQTNFRILNIGAQLGYQFVINNRWAIDLILIGPSVSNYRASMKLKGDFTFDKEEVENEVLLKILDRFPMLNDILTNKEVSSQGKFNTWSYGWRYQINVGFHFGRKTK